MVAVVRLQFLRRVHHLASEMFSEMISSIYVGPGVFVGVVVISSIFYSLNNHWDVSSAIFFATQTLLGCNFGGLPHADQLSKEVTLGVYVLGTTMIAAAVSSFTADMVTKSKHIVEDERKRNRELPSAFSHAWPGSLSIVSLALSWCGLGVCWGVFYEGLTIRAAIYFALSAMSARGDPDPVVTCTTTNTTPDGTLEICGLGTLRAGFYCLYCLVGCNIYVQCMGRYAGTLSEYAIRASEKKLLEQPIRRREYSLVMSLKNLASGEGAPAAAGAGLGEDAGPIALNVHDFIILEALRLEKINTGFISEVLDLFRRIDEDGNGILEAADLLAYRRKCLGTDLADAEAEAGDGSSSYNALFVPLITTPNPNSKASVAGQGVAGMREERSHEEYLTALATPPDRKGVRRRRE